MSEIKLDSTSVSSEKDYSHLLINCQRLLERCESLFSSKNNIFNSDDNEIPSFISYCNCLKEQVQLLNDSYPKYNPNDKKLIEEFKHRLTTLCSFVSILKQDSLPKINTADISMLDINNISPLLIHSENRSKEVEILANNISDSESRRRLFKEANSTTKSNESKKTFEVYHNTDKKKVYYEEDKKEKELLTSELHNMTNSLKEYVLKINEHLKSEKKVLDDTTNSTSLNATRISKENKRMNITLSEGWWSTIIMYCTLFLVIIIFFCTYLFMRIFPKSR